MVSQVNPSCFEQYACGDTFLHPLRRQLDIVASEISALQEQAERRREARAAATAAIMALQWGDATKVTR